MSEKDFGIYTDLQKQLTKADKSVISSVHLPRTRMNFDLDQDERHMINKADNLTSEELWEILEQKRYNDFKNKAIAL
jgi:hypothetical protein